MSRLHFPRHPKLFFGVLVCLLISLSLITPILVEARDRQEYLEAATPETPLNMSKYTKDAQEADFTHLGDSIFPSAVGGKSVNGKLNYLHEGAGMAVIGGISYLAGTPPVYTGEYVAYALRNLNIASPAYAQGVGFSSLSPLLDVWKAFRNIAYFLFTVVFLVVGFMIMFRAKIDPQTVVSIQAALPKLIVTLILITFSYAIAGLVIDFIYLITFFVIGVFKASGIISNQTLALNTIFGESVFQIGRKYFLGYTEAAGTGANAISDIIGSLFGTPQSGVLGAVLDWITDSLAYLVIAVLIFLALLRTFLGLLMAYVGLIIGVIFAPIQLLLNAFPGANTFTAWLRSLAANAAVFPAVAIMIIIGAYLAGGNTEQMGVNSLDPASSFGSQTSGSGFVPPLLVSGGYNWGDNAAGQPVGLIQLRAIIGLGFILLLPEVVKMVKTALEVKDGGVSGAFGAVGSGFGMVYAPIKNWRAIREEERRAGKQADAIGRAIRNPVSPGKS